MTTKTVIAPSDIGRGLVINGNKLEANIGQNLSFNGNRLEAAGKDVLYASRNTVQPGFQTNVTLIFNTLNFVRGTGITLDTATGIFTLQPGKAYALEGSIGGVSGGGTGYLAYAWRSVGGTFHDSGGGLYSTNLGILSAWDPVARTVLVPTAALQVALVGTTWTGVANAGYAVAGTRLLPTAVIREL